MNTNIIATNTNIINPNKTTNIMNSNIMNSNIINTNNTNIIATNIIATNILLNKYENITKEDIDNIDNFIDIRNKEKKEYIKYKGNELIKIINYFKYKENFDQKFLFGDIETIFGSIELLFNPNIDINEIEKMDLSIYDWIEWVSRNPNLTINYVMKDKNKYNWLWILSNSGITIKDIMDNKNIVDQYIIDNFDEIIFENKNLTYQHILYYKLSIDLLLLENNLLIPLNVLEIHIQNGEINYQSLSKNTNLNMAFIKKYIDKPWNWKSISENECIKLNDIENNLNLKWRWDFISSNPNLNIAFIKKYYNKNWNWEKISYNAGINMTDIENNMGLNWIWDKISLNPNLTLEFIKKYENKFIIINDRINNLSSIALNEFLYNDFIYKKNIQYDIKNKKLIIHTILNKFIYNDVLNTIISYIYY